MSLSDLKASIPWPVKIGAKIVLSRLPVPYGFWSSLNLFKHGPMEDFDYARGVFARHHLEWGKAGGPGAFTMLELGPGDSLITALLARSLGAKRTWLVDTGSWARADVDFYRRAARVIFPKDLPDRPAFERWTSVVEMLDDCRASYLTAGLASLRSLQAESVDILWSQAVLEHVRRSELPDTFVEMRRLLSPRGVASHVIDFKDHLGGRLNSLRFSEPRWEGKLFSSSGFYTNRFRSPQVVAMANEVGLIPEIRRATRWEKLPTARNRMDPSFRSMPEEDLLVSEIHLVLKRPTPG